MYFSIQQEKGRNQVYMTQVNKDAWVANKKFHPVEFSFSN